jgi:acyl carrier protein
VEFLASTIAQQQCVSPHTVFGDTRLTEDLGLDSLEMQSLLLTLEEHYGIYLLPGALNHVVTVKDLAAVIAKTARSSGAES